MPTNDLAALSKAATPGTWEMDSEQDSDGAYGGGPDHGTGYHNYFVGAEVGGKWKTLLDTVNSDHKLIDEDYDEDGGCAWDVIGHANAAFIVALVNEYRAGRLVPVEQRDKAEALLCQRTNEYIEATARAEAAEARNKVLEEALDGVMIGGNHLALLIGADHPAYGTDHYAALEHYGAGDHYEAWCAWNAIMLARQALGGEHER